MSRESKNTFTTSGDQIAISRSDWDFNATAIIRDDYAKDLRTVTWSKSGYSKIVLEKSNKK